MPSPNASPRFKRELRSPDSDTQKRKAHERIAKLGRRCGPSSRWGPTETELRHASCALRMPQRHPRGGRRRHCPPWRAAPAATGCGLDGLMRLNGDQRTAVPSRPRRLSAPCARSPITPRPRRGCWWLSVSSAKVFNAPHRRIRRLNRAGFRCRQGGCGWPCRMRFSIAGFVDQPPSG